MRKLFSSKFKYPRFFFVPGRAEVKHLRYATVGSFHGTIQDHFLIGVKVFYVGFSLLIDPAKKIVHIRMGNSRKAGDEEQKQYCNTDFFHGAASLT